MTVADQLSLTWEVILDCPGEPRVITRGPRKGKKAAGEQVRVMQYGKGSPKVAGFEGGGKEP